MENINKIKNIIKKILKKNGIAKAGIFGSYAKRENKRKSDIDILIQPPRSMSLLGFVHVKHELEDVLRRKVDLVSYKYIHPRLKSQILKEEVRLL